MLALEPDTDERIAAHTINRGVSEAGLIRALIEEGLDAAKIVVEGLIRPLRPLTSAEARNVVGEDV